MALTMYDAPETASMNSKHTILLKFQYGEHKAEVVTTIGGNVCGAELLAGYDADDIACLTAPVDNEINKKHCIFEEDGNPFQYVESIRFFHPTRPEETVEISEAAKYLVGIEIIGYESREDEEDENLVECEHCGKKVEFNGDDDFHFEVPSGHFPPPHDRGKGVCGTCWETQGYKEKYEEYHKGLRQ